VAHQSNESLQRAIDAARPFCLRMNVLGSYPRAQEVM
jgi:hypothetical protein